MRQRAAIGHLDADCFYVSAERVRSAFLFNKPVGILGNQGAFVIAKSYEMKASGVKTGEPIWDALVKCPQGVYVKRDFRWYEALSRAMLDVMNELSPRVEYYSIDEFFFEATPLPGCTLQQTAEYMRDHIWQRTRVPVTVGIARTKTLAKLISDRAKPFGALAVLDRDLEQSMLGVCPVTDVCGIASGRAAKLAAHGMTTALDMALADRKFIRQLLTVVGEALWYELNGEPIQPLHTKRPPHKTLSRGGNIGKPTADRDYVWGWVVRSLERLIEELDYHRVKTATLEVQVGYRDGRFAIGKTRPLAPTARFDLLLEAARAGLRQCLIPGQVVNRLHLLATELHWPGAAQGGLFELPAEQAETIAQLKREVNARHGRFALRSGATLFLREIYKDEAYNYEICDVREKMCF